MNKLEEVLNARFNGAPSTQTLTEQQRDCLLPLAARGSDRLYKTDPVDLDLVRTLCAVALSAPTKSDMQQRDIVIVSNPELRAKLAALIDQEWVAKAPLLLVFCGNNQRQRLVHEMRDIPFANDHLDAFFNAAVDAAIALSAFVTAAEAAGLACCPISAIRNEAATVCDLLGLPAHVFPVAGLGLGWPVRPPRVSPRLPLTLTVHENRYAPGDIEAGIARYDVYRRERQPFGSQRAVETFGASETYSWSDDKARQYSVPEREGFGDFVRGIGFKLD